MRGGYHPRQKNHVIGEKESCGQGNIEGGELEGDTKGKKIKVE